jgi:hypothetical protein
LKGGLYRKEGGVGIREVRGKGHSNWEQQ